ncbi:hypothetical protein N7455_007849 [Penicillium solitum]|uniref:uncharacterized protein n=1 Tax=Penicillium solitum TaxID=60172 RepID=UPI0032C405AD|nr:hypothetical protein N7455_007849 [Penicillium solitum]
MPPRGSSHKLRVPIFAKTHLMYDLSVGDCEEDWTEGDSVALHPLVVQFYAETYDGKNCKLCNHLHKPCESVPEGIGNNRYELLACISWAEQFVEDVIPESTRVILGFESLVPTRPDPDFL